MNNIIYLIILFSIPIIIFYFRNIIIGYTREKGKYLYKNFIVDNKTKKEIARIIFDLRESFNSNYSLSEVYNIWQNKHNELRKIFYANKLSFDDIDNYFRKNINITNLTKENSIMLLKKYQKMINKKIYN